MRFRHAICNEIFKDWPFAEACAAIKKAGYEGIEIAPFTLAEDPATVTPPQRAEFRRMIGDAGLEFVGLHWIMVSPKGLHVTTPDAALRERSWLHVRNLIDLCADLGPNGVIVFGSPFQRSTTGGMSRGEATKHFQQGFADLAPHAQERGVTLLVEALPTAQSDVVTTVAEAVSIVDAIGSPAVRTMFDTHNAADETEPHSMVLERFFPYVRHVHVNEMDGSHPGMGDYDFAAIFEVLNRKNYKGWVSLEAFNFEAGSERIANESIQHLNKQIARLGASA
jgi:D-psicose/D-tagatose/L-ribulose 3-epimerase